MAFAAGTRFGVYEIGGLIGVGGMGEVYRASDTTLGREVALKALPDSFAADVDRIARFEREAKPLRRSITQTSAKSSGWSAAMERRPSSWSSSKGRRSLIGSCRGRSPSMRR